MFRRAMSSTTAFVNIPLTHAVGLKDMLANYITWQNAITIAAMATTVNQFLTSSQIDALRNDVNASQAMTWLQIEVIKGDVSALKGDVSALKGDVGAIKSTVERLAAKLDAAVDSRSRGWF